MKTNYLMLLAITFLFYACEGQQKQESQESDLNSEEPIAATDTPVAPAYNSLSDEEKNTGWQLLFDGKSTNGWHNYLQEGVSGWTVSNGELSTAGGNGDLVTDETFENFELSLEYKIEPESNSGFFFYIIEDPKYKRTHHTAPEYQIIDDEGYPAELKPAQKSGANYDIHPPSTLAAKGPGEYNEAKIIVENDHVIHYLNGEKVVEYNLGSKEWKDKVEASKFSQWDYAETRSGKIGLQDHGDPITFRNIKIRKL